MMAERKASLNMADLEAIHEDRVSHLTATPIVPPVVPAAVEINPNVSIFDEICQDVEEEDLEVDASIKSRRGSMTTQEESDLPAPPVVSHHRRRHSSFESRLRRDARLAHADFKLAQQELEDKRVVRRASFVNNMMEFNLSIEMNSLMMMSQVSLQEQDNVLSPAMQFSCPVLSYMNDEEEDSVELRLMKEENDARVQDSLNWESLKDVTLAPTSSTNATNATTDYVIQMPALPDETDLKPRRRKRRKPHSYKLLEQQLEEHSPMHVLSNLSSRNFNTLPQHETITPSAPSSTTTTTTMHTMVLPSAAAAKNLDTPQPKSLEQSEGNQMRAAFLQTQDSPPSNPTRPAMARGA